MKLRFKRGLVLVFVIALMATTLLACAGSGGSGSTDTGSTGTSDSGNAGAEKSETPAAPEKPKELEKVRVSLWDRSNAPDGTPILEGMLVKHIVELAKTEGLDVEFVPLPRAQESEKNSTWMASGGGPDILITYDVNAVFKWAEQGGLTPLDDLIAQHGQDIVKVAGPAMEAAGTYKGVRYAIPALRMNQAAGASMKIRQDWLDKLGMQAPTTIEELYTVLKAFKEQDPGGVGKENVVPWALPAINQGMRGFFFGPMYGFGLLNDGPHTEMYWASGNFKDGVFTSSVAMEEGKEYFRWMNRLYKEGLISKEFVTDINNQQYIQHITTGTAGFTESNDDPWGQMTVQTRKTVPGAKWVTLEALKGPDGKQHQNLAGTYGLYNIIPKSSKNPAAAVKYLNFMAKNITLFQSGIEGEHYSVQNGVRVAIDPDKNAKELAWYLPDLNLLTQGYMGIPTAEQMEIMYSKQTPEDRAEMIPVYEAYYKNFTEHGKTQPLIDTPRPVAEKSLVNITKYLYEALSKAIIAPDFDKEWEAVVSGWEKNGGREYDAEVTEALKAMNYKSWAEQ